MITITRNLEFDAGHRVLGHEGKCDNLHGHRYRAEVTVFAQELDDLGMVIDFGIVKEKVGGWIDENWDHNMILHSDDPLMEFDTEDGRYFDIEIAERIVGRKPFVMPDKDNPTAENMAKFLYYKSQDLLFGSGISVTNIRIYETPNCWADFNGSL